MVARRILPRLLFAAGLLVAVALTAALPTHAQDSTADATMALPEQHRLDGLTLFWQDYNRCSAAALTIQFSYFGTWSGMYTDTVSFLNPHPEDVSVRLDEMIAYAEENDMRGIERMGGTVEMLKVLTANGFPVLVENVYYDGPDVDRDWMSHNRIVIGYDDAQQVFWTYDSLLGAGEDQAGRPVPYEDLVDRWRPFNRGYFVLYEPEDEPLLQALMGDHWDEEFNAEWGLQLAQADLEEFGDSYARFNMGTALVALGRYDEAATAFDEARAIGLPWRMLWYQFGPFEAYLQTERYDDVVNLTRTVIDATPGVEEMYYYIALAYAAQGDVDRARANLDVALQRNSNFITAARARAELDAVAGDAGRG